MIIFGPLLIMVVLFGRGGLSGIIGRVLVARDAVSKDTASKKVDQR